MDYIYEMFAYFMLKIALWTLVDKKRKFMKNTDVRKSQSILKNT